MAQIQQLIGGLGGEAIGTPPASMHALALHRWIDRNVQETQNGCFCGPRCAGLQGCRMGLPFLKCLPRSSPLGGASPFEWHEAAMSGSGFGPVERTVRVVECLPCSCCGHAVPWNASKAGMTPLKHLSHSGLLLLLSFRCLVFLPPTPPPPPPPPALLLLVSLMQSEWAGIMPGVGLCMFSERMERLPRSSGVVETV